MPVARIVTLKNPPTDPARTHVDHADRDATNDCAANLHWVTPAFNIFNIHRKTFAVTHSGRRHGIYRNSESAALVYKLVYRLHYDDQLDKVPERLNTVKDNMSTRSKKGLTACNSIRLAMLLS